MPSIKTILVTAAIATAVLYAANNYAAFGRVVGQK
jgi:hypothetical protein